MKHKIFIDGKEGTTGLRIYERIASRDDIELLTIDENLRKDINERKRLINESDITFLCLPDQAAIESVSLLDNDHTKIIDASTAHRTLDNWAYGFAELSDDHYNKIKNNQLVAVPGCHASGFIAIVYPLIKLGIMNNDYPFVCNSITGYSGGGKKMITDYSETKDISYEAPRLYAMGQSHKHLKEMKKITGIAEPPIFNPIVSSFYSGMLVTVGIQVSKMNIKMSARELNERLMKFYDNKKLVKVIPYNEKGTETGFLSSNLLSGYDNMFIFVNGNDDRISISALYDNLGKGASGAAIECMNIMLNLDEELGLNIKENL